MKVVSLLFFLRFAGLSGWAESGVVIPATTTHVFDYRPFLNAWPSTIRYQQVFSSIPFSVVNSNDIYLTRIRLQSDSDGAIDIRNIQINLSTTPRTVDSLSTNFAENVGLDDTLVFGPGECFMPDQFTGSFELAFQRPFVYNRMAGNLLVDVRVFDGIHSPLVPPYFYPSLNGQLVVGDYISRVWTEDVNAAVATNRDSGGFEVALLFDPIPSLRSYISSFGTSTNFIVIEWPSYPPVFKLQRSPSIGSDASWETLTGAGTPLGNSQVYFIPFQSSGQSGYYRLIWPGGP